MKIVYIIISGSMLLLPCGCRQEEADIEPVPACTEFYASLDRNIISKIQIGQGESSYPVLWESGDRIAIFGGTAQEHASIYRTDDGNSSVARFRYDRSLPANIYPESSDFYTAIYPASAERYGEEISFLLPAIQTYNKDGIGKEAWPMVGTGNSGCLSFTGVCGILKIRLHGTETDFSIDKISAGALQNIGGAKCRYSPTGKPVWEIPPAKDGTTGKTVILDCSGSCPEPCPEGTDFYISMPPGRYTDLSFQIKTSDNRYYIYSIPGTTEIARNTMFLLDLPVQAFTNIPDSYLESGQKCVKVIGMEYAFSVAQQISENGEHHLIVRSFRTTELKDRPQIIEGSGWKAFFSTDGGATFSSIEPSFLNGIETSGQGSHEGEYLYYTIDSGSPECIIRFVQDISGKSCIISLRSA